MKSAKLIFLQISGILALIQLLITLLFFSIIPDLGAMLNGLIDLILVTVIATPITYWFIIRPYIRINQKLLKKIQDHDEITHLGNRRLLYEQLKHLLSYNTRHQIYGAILQIDIQNLNYINEHYGKDALQRIYVITAKRLIAATRREDFICHTNNSDFYVLLCRLTDDKTLCHPLALSSAKRILEIIRKPVYYKKHMIEINPYIGVRLIGPEITSIRQVLNDLDIALYNAKRFSTTQIGVFIDKPASIEK
jgi:two-component system cell cycle response regulator